MIDENKMISKLIDSFRNKNPDEKTRIFVPKFSIIRKAYLDTVYEFWEVWGKKDVFWRGSYSGRSLISCSDYPHLGKATRDF